MEAGAGMLRFGVQARAYWNEVQGCGKAVTRLKENSWK